MQKESKHSKTRTQTRRKKDPQSPDPKDPRIHPDPLRARSPGLHQKTQIKSRDRNRQTRKHEHPQRQTSQAPTDKEILRSHPAGSHESKPGATPTGHPRRRPPRIRSSPPNDRKSAETGARNKRQNIADPPVHGSQMGTAGQGNHQRKTQIPRQNGRKNLQRTNKTEQKDGN